VFLQDLEKDFNLADAQKAIFLHALIDFNSFSPKQILFFLFKHLMIMRPERANFKHITCGQANKSFFPGLKYVVFQFFHSLQHSG